MSNYAYIELSYSEKDGLLSALKFSPAAVPNIEAQTLYDSINSIKNLRNNQIEGELERLEQEGQVKLISKTSTQLVYQVL